MSFPRRRESVLVLRMVRHYYVYIMANNRPTLYIGITNNIGRRSVEHKYKLIDGFTKEYNLSKLVYFEDFTDVKEAIKREKQLKHWNRAWKLKLIQTTNPKFEDLYDRLIFGGRKNKGGSPIRSGMTNE